MILKSKLFAESVVEGDGLNNKDAIILSFHFSEFPSHLSLS